MIQWRKRKRERKTIAVCFSLVTLFSRIVLNLKTFVIPFITCLQEPNGKIKLAKNQLFFNLDHFREILKDYAIQKGFQLYRVKNGRRRVTCECNTHGCTWMIHGSPTPEKVTFQIKTYYTIHTCIRTTRNNDAKSN